MADMPMMIPISKTAQALINAGKARYGSGGVRLLDGTLFELYKVVAPSNKGQAARIIAKTVSQIFTDPQSMLNAMPEGTRELAIRFAQTMLNSAVKDPQKATQIAGTFLKTAGGVAANLGSVTGGLAAIPNLYMTYQNGQKLNQVIQAVASLQNIAWAGTAVSSANLALSAVSFAVLTHKIDGISQKLDIIAEEIKQEIHKVHRAGMVLKTKILIDNLMSTVHILEQNSITKEQTLQIEPYLNEAKNMIQWWVNEFNGADCEESNTIFTLLFDLAAMYAAVLKEYGAQYYYLIGSYPGSYDNWVQAFNFIDLPEVRKKLKQTLWVSNPVAPTEKLADAFDFTLNSIRLQAQDIAEYKEIVPYLPKEAHDDFDAYIKSKIEKGEVEIVDQAETEDPREAVLLQQNGYTAA